MKSIFKSANIIVSFLVMIFIIMSCEKLPEQVSVTDVTLDATSLALIEGDVITLTATVSPSNADNKTVLWSSSNGSVASVDKGTVKALSEGSSVITAKTDDGGKTATCTVTVRKKTVNVTGISLDVSTIVMTEGESFQIKASLNPADATETGLEWTSSDDSIASVENGLVRAHKAGEVKIQVKTKDGGYTAECDVIVKEMVIAVEGISLDKTEIEMEEGSQEVITATIVPSNASDKTIKWSSNDISVATVNEGIVSALSEGWCTIRAETADGGFSEACFVTVKAKPIVIQFADPEVKRICVEHWDENGDGELSNFEAASVGYMGDTFENQVDITSFDEFKYFKGIAQNSYSFKGCIRLKSISFPEHLTAIHNMNGCTSLESVVIPDKVRTISSRAFYNCTSLESVVLPDKITLETNCFYGCKSLNGIVLPDNTTLDTRAYGCFENCTSLQEIVIPESVTILPESTFRGCSSLAKVVLHESMTRIGPSAFDGCSALKSIKFPESMESFGINAFKNSGLEEIVIPDNVTTIDFSLFYGCKYLRSVTLPDSVTSIGDRAFNRCGSLVDIKLSRKLQKIGSYAFSMCDSLREIELPRNVVSIDQGAFSNCKSLVSVNIPEMVSTIAKETFYYCSSLTSFTIPENVSEIGERAFWLCESLQSVYCEPVTPPSLGKDAFMNAVNIFVPDGSLSDYLSDSDWSGYKVKSK